MVTDKAMDIFSYFGMFLNTCITIHNLKQALSVLWCNVGVALHSLLWKCNIFSFFSPNISDLCAQVL